MHLLQSGSASPFQGTPQIALLRIQDFEIAMLRFLLLAVLLACVSAFVPPATLAQRSVVA